MMPPARDGVGATWSWTRTEWVCVALLALLVLAVYGPIPGHAFVTLDDPFFVSENEALRPGLSWAGIRWAITAVHAQNWMPLTWISFLADESIHGRSAAGVLTGQLVLHLASTVLLFEALRRILGATGPALFVAAVFATHPLNVEVVAWASERKGTLSGFFWMLCLVLHARDSADATPTPRRKLALALAMAASLLAKQVAVTLPFALLLLDYWPLRRITDPSGRIDAPLLRAAIVGKTPLFALSALGCAMALYGQGAGEAIVPFESLGLSDRVLNVLQSYAAFLFDFVWPTDLAVYYPTATGLGWREATIPIAILSGVSVAAWHQRLDRPWILVGWLWFLGVLVPMIGVVQLGGQARADRYMYLPSIGLALAIAWSVHVWARSPERRVFAGLASVAVAVALAVMATHQRNYWKGGVSLFSHALEVSGSHFILHEHLGLALLGEGRVEEGRGQLERAIRGRHSTVILNNLAWSYATHPDAALQRPERALAYARANVARSGERPELLDTLAAAHAAAEDFGAALRIQRRAVQLAEDGGHHPLAAILSARIPLYEARRPLLDHAQGWGAD